jgi:hypothetical protein
VGFGVLGEFEVGGGHVAVVEGFCGFQFYGFLVALDGLLEVLLFVLVVALQLGLLSCIDLWFRLWFFGGFGFVRWWGWVIFLRGVLFFHFVVVGSEVWVIFFHSP